MTENKIIIPIWKKSNLTVEEAAAYCGIGSRKLREMSDSEFCPFVLWNGSKRLIKRRKLDGSSSSIVFYSARGIERLKDLTGRGADHDSCGTHKPEDQ